MHPGPVDRARRNRKTVSRDPDAEAAEHPNPRAEGTRVQALRGPRAKLRARFVPPPPRASGAEAKRQRPTTTLLISSDGDRLIASL